MMPESELTPEQEREFQLWLTRLGATRKRWLQEVAEAEFEAAYESKMFYLDVDSTPGSEV